MCKIWALIFNKPTWNMSYENSAEINCLTNLPFLFLLGGIQMIRDTLGGGGPGGQESVNVTFFCFLNSDMILQLCRENIFLVNFLIVDKVTFQSILI